MKKMYLYIVCSTPEESVAGNDACIHSPNDDNVDDHILTNNKTMHATTLLNTTTNKKKDSFGG